VDGFHSYFVSDFGVLVHNACDINDRPSPALKNDPYHPDAVEQRIRPHYVPNIAHDLKSSLFNFRKTPEPSNASQVYQNAVCGNMGTWYGVGKDGNIYRFFSDNSGGVHFSGIVSSQIVPNNVLKQIKS
jgi:hypothetical protein